tara:strand:+ start:552 stop:785 length:234 start_codon:yes stop_codon:yes gene_type:complete
MYTELKKTIIRLIVASNEGAITINRAFRRLAGTPKKKISLAIKELIREEKIKMLVATGETADYLNVQPGTEVYILTR